MNLVSAATEIDSKDQDNLRKGHEALLERIKNAIGLSDCACELHDSDPFVEFKASAQRKSLDVAKEQLAKLRGRMSGGARIAIVGSEKSGKSTLLNSWLGKIVLPIDLTRCTRAATDILAIPPSDSESLEVEFLSQDEFDRLLSESRNSRNQAGSTDSDEIERHEKSLRSLLGKPTLVQRSGTPDVDFASDLKRYVASPDYAYAVKGVRLRCHIPGLPVGSTMVDAPGIDSGVKTHKDALARLLDDCDAVVLVKNIQHPDPNEAEQALLQHAKQGASSQGLRLSSRLFLFLNRLDQQRGLDEVRDMISTARDNWGQHKISSDRIFAGSARASLLKTQSCAAYMKEANLTDADVDYCISHTQTLINALEVGCFEELKNKVIDFSARTRFSEAESSVQTQLANIRGIARNIVSEFERANEISGQGEIDPKKLWNRYFYKWVHHYFDRRISSELNIVFDDGTNQIASLSDPPSAYISVIREEFTKLVTLAELDTIFDRYKKPLPKPDVANDQARAALYIEIDTAMTNRGRHIADLLYEQVSKLNQKVVALCWGDTCVKDTIIGEERIYLAEIRASVNSLLMRYVRPVNEAFIYSRANSVTRKHAEDDWRNALATVSLYMSSANTTGSQDGRSSSFVPRETTAIYREVGQSMDGSKLVSKTLSKWWQQRRTRSNEPTTDPRNGKMDTGNSAPARDKPERILPPVDNRPRSKEPDFDPHGYFNEVLKEITSDLEKVRGLLETGVYKASGVREYCDRELRRIREAVTNPEHRYLWTNAARNALDTKHPQFMQMIKEELGDPEGGAAKSLIACYNRLNSFLDFRPKEIGGQGPAFDRADRSDLQGEAVGARNRSADGYSEAAEDHARPVASEASGLVGTEVRKVSSAPRLRDRASRG